MKPILFDENATSFNTNGLGRLDCISCQVVEERNGMFELELQIAETALHAKEIEMSSIIVAKPSQDKGEQAFRVYKITKPIGGIFSVYARHISYQLSFIPVMPFAVTASDQAANQTLQGLKTNAVESCPFNFVTDVTTVASYKQTVPASLRSRLGGVEGSVLDQFGGEYEWDNYTVNLWRNRGVTTPRVTLRYGKNITDLNQEKNIEDTITGIVPYWQDSEGENTLTLPEKVVESQTAGSYPFKRTVPYDFSQSFEEGTIPTEAQLRAKATAYINQAGIGVPKVSIKVSFINLADTVEYKSIAALQTVELCDEVGVYFEKLGIETTAKVVKTEYDVLAERYNSIELGSLRGTLASTISGQQASMNALENNTKRMFAQYSNEVGELIDEATAWLTSGDGYVMATKDQEGNWKEILFMDTNDPETAHNVLRINQNGLGFSSTGVAGPYTQAWTLDGKMVIGGTNVPSLTVYDNSSPPKILFQINAQGMQWDAANSSMTPSGLLTALGATLTNANILSEKSNRKIQINNGRITFGDDDAYIDYDRRRISGNTYASVLTEHSDNYIFLENENDDYVKIYDNNVQISSGHNFFYGTGPYANIELERGRNSIIRLETWPSHTQQTTGSEIILSDDGGVTIHGTDAASIGGGNGDISFGIDTELESNNDMTIRASDMLWIYGHGGIELHSNYGNIGINGNVPIYDIGMSLTITTSYPSGYALVDYFYTENDTWYVGIDYDTYPCTNR